LLALRWFVPGAGLAEGLGMVPALGMAMTTLTTFAVIAVVRSPLSLGLSLASVLLAVGLGTILWWASRMRPNAARS
jgi:xanthine/uracil permease